MLNAARVQKSASSVRHPHSDLTGILKPGSVSTLPCGLVSPAFGNAASHDE